MARMHSGSNFLSLIFHWLIGSLDTWPKVQPLLNMQYQNVPGCLYNISTLISGSRNIARRLQFCDCIIEVHDARVSIHRPSCIILFLYSYIAPKVHSDACFSISPIPISHSLVAISISNSCSEEGPSYSS